jgi:hypothetical protein
VSVELEQRLRAYGTTIDAATASDLVARDAPVAETSLEPVDYRRRRIVKLVAAVVLAGAVASGVLAVVHRQHAAVTAPASTSTTRPGVKNCTAPALTLNQRIACRRRNHPYVPHYSNVGSGTDGLPTPAQQAALAREKTQYDPAEVQLLLHQAKANGNVPTDQALVSALEFRNACRQLLVAATVAESLPRDRIAAVVDSIMEPEVARLTARTTAGSTSNQLFEQDTKEIIAGHAEAVRHELGRHLCIAVIAPQP